MDEPLTSGSSKWKGDSDGVTTMTPPNKKESATP